MQEELLRSISAAYQQHIHATVQALDITQGAGGADGIEHLTNIVLDTREEQLEFLRRVDEAERDWQKLNLDRSRLAHIREDGYRRGQEKGAKTENPYLPVSIEHVFWYRGWCQGMNLFPISEVPMRDVFEMDRPVTRFKKQFRIDELLNKCAERILAVEHPEVQWASMSELARKPYMLKAVSFLEAMMGRAPLGLTHSADSSNAASR